MNPGACGDTDEKNAHLLETHPMADSADCILWSLLRPLLFLPIVLFMDKNVGTWEGEVALCVAHCK